MSVIVATVIMLMCVTAAAVTLCLWIARVPSEPGWFLPDGGGWQVFAPSTDDTLVSESGEVFTIDDGLRPVLRDAREHAGRLWVRAPVVEREAPFRARGDRPLLAGREAKPERAVAALRLRWRARRIAAAIAAFAIYVGLWQLGVGRFTLAALWGRTTDATVVAHKAMVDRGGVHPCALVDTDEGGFIPFFEHGDPVLPIGTKTMVRIRGDNAYFLPIVIRPSTFLTVVLLTLACGVVPVVLVRDGERQERQERRGPGHTVGMAVSGHDEDLD